MFLNVPKISNEYRRAPFSSDFTERSLYFFINESLKLENEGFEIGSIISESFLNEDFLMLNEGSKEFVDSVIKYFTTSKKYIDDMWNKFSLDYSITQKETASLVGKAINGIEADGSYIYQGYRYAIGDENIHINRATNSMSELRTKLMRNEINKDKASSENMDRIRGQVLGMSSISAEDFHSELLRHYRGGRIRPLDIAVTPTVRDEMIDTLFDSDIYLSSCVHLKNDILRFIDSVIAHFKNLKALAEDNVNTILKNSGGANNFKEKINSGNVNTILKNSGGANNFKEKINSENVNTLITVDVGYYKKLLSIYTLVFSTKLDVINERHRVYTKIVKQMMKENNN